jgi:hypothetical protein
MADNIIPDPLAEAEKTYRAIGRFMFEFSQTEYTLRHALAVEVLKDPDACFAVVDALDVAALCNVAKKTFKASRSPEIADRIESEINRFLALNQERVRVAHGVWIPYFNGGMVRHVSRTSLNPAILSERASTLEKLGVEAGEIRTRLHAAVLALPEPQSIPVTP